ncbi:MAG: hypothetical protein WBV82_14895 [Myxococcaceae bacterium]
MRNTVLLFALLLLAGSARAADGEVQCEGIDALAVDMVEGAAKGGTRTISWTRSDDELSLSLKRGADERTFAPPCALALYEALAKRGEYMPELVVPLPHQYIVPLATREAAARRAIRDLDRYPESERNRVAAALVVAGYKVPVKVRFQKSDAFDQQTELEAAARQGDKAALAEIERFVLCRGTFRPNGIELLGYLNTKSAADTAYELAQKCPLTLGAATAALVRMKDPRAFKVLGKALETRSANDDLTRAVIESFTPALGSELRRLAAKDVSRADDLLQRLKTAGVIKD